MKRTIIEERHRASLNNCQVTGSPPMHMSNKKLFYSVAKSTDKPSLL